jgi:Sec7-like guanine-nucleotide exchange factor
MAKTTPSLAFRFENPLSNRYNGCIMFLPVAFILNLPWAVVGILLGIISFPTRVSFDRSILAVILEVKSFWWQSWVSSKKGVRASTIGHVVLISPRSFEKDLDHELVHVKQHIKKPFIQPFLYFIETLRKGYKDNKYEIEAYSQSNSKYLE